MQVPTTLEEVLYLASSSDALNREPDLIRALSVSISSRNQTPHLGSVLSCAEIISCAQRIKAKYPYRISLTLSKGHAALGLYCSLLLRKKISESELLSFAQTGSFLEEHPNPELPEVDFPSGSLGHGLSLVSGYVLGSDIQNLTTGGIVIMSDGECNEGTVWEAALFVATKKISRLVAIIDANGWQATGRVSETFGTASLKAMFEGFGWRGQVVDGHNAKILEDAINYGLISGGPYFIVAETTKGKGVSFMEDDNNWHYRIPNQMECQRALAEIFAGNL